MPKIYCIEKPLLPEKMIGNHNQFYPKVMGLPPKILLLVDMERSEDEYSFFILLPICFTTFSSHDNSISSPIR